MCQHTAGMFEAGPAEVPFLRHTKPVILLRVLRLLLLLLQACVLSAESACRHHAQSFCEVVTRPPEQQ